VRSRNAGNRRHDPGDGILLRRRWRRRSPGNDEPHHLATTEIVGTDLSFGLALSAVGGLIHAGLGDVNTAVLWKLLVGGAAGAFAGSALAAHLPSKKLRFALCLALVYIGGQLSWSSFSKMYSSSVSAAGPASATAPASPAPAAK
jgi:uncharacterized membrane protein YfcA